MWNYFIYQIIRWHCLNLNRGSVELDENRKNGIMRQQSIWAALINYLLWITIIQFAC